jgi:Metallo-beta-lactamase superfamily
MREVVDGVIEIPIGYVKAYAVVVDDGVVLVDTGIPGRADKVARAIVAARRRIGEVHTILLTHWHPDHVGSVAELRRRSGARVVAHPIDAQLIAGGTKAQPPKGLMRVVAAIMPPPEPVPVDEALTADGPISVPGFMAIHTPGHTRGHTSFSSTAAAACSLPAMRPVVGAMGGSGVRRGWLPRTVRPSWRASRGSGTSVSSRPYSGTVGRYHEKRRSGSGSSPYAASSTAPRLSAGCSIDRQF